MEVTIAADLTAISRFVKTLDKADATVLRKKVRDIVKDVGGDMMAEAKANARWSTGHTSRPAKRTRKADAVGDVHSSIPSAITLTTSFAARSGRVTMKVNRKKAPHAYFWERGSANGGGKVLRHPVFGRKDKPHDWQQSPTRPFFFPAAVKHREVFKSRMQGALADILASITTAA